MSMKYLILTIYDIFSWMPYVEIKKLVVIYRKLEAFSTSRRGRNRELLRKWYLVVGEWHLCYAAPCWASNLGTHAINKLKSAQKIALLFISKTYRRTSTADLNILTSIYLTVLIE